MQQLWVFSSPGGILPRSRGSVKSRIVLGRAGTLQGGLGHCPGEDWGTVPGRTWMLSR